MKLKTTLEIVQARYPDLLAQFTKELRQSKSVSKYMPEIHFKHYIWACEKIVGCAKITAEERITNSFAHLHIFAGRFQRSYSIPIPLEVVQVYHESEQKMEKKQQEFDALTPEQKQERINNLVSELTGNKGFMKISV